jgi:hypothetical protein
MNFRLLLFAFVTLLSGLSLTMAAVRAGSLLWVDLFGIATMGCYLALLMRSFGSKP